jgi:hypothetical protein
MVKIRALLFAVITCLGVSSTGCEAFVQALPAAIPIVTNSLMLVQQIADFASQYFKAAPNPDRERAVAESVSKTRGALIDAHKKSASTDDVNAAFSGFRAEYGALLEACRGIPGFSVAPDGEEPTFGASPGTLVVPSPNSVTRF